MISEVWLSSKFKWKLFSKNRQFTYVYHQKTSSCTCAISNLKSKSLHFKILFFYVVTGSNFLFRKFVKYTYDFYTNGNSLQIWSLKIKKIIIIITFLNNKLLLILFHLKLEFSECFVIKLVCLGFQKNVSFETSLEFHLSFFFFDILKVTYRLLVIYQYRHNKRTDTNMSKLWLTSVNKMNNFTSNSTNDIDDKRTINNGNWTHHSDVKFWQ